MAFPLTAGWFTAAAAGVGLLIAAWVFVSLSSHSRSLDRVRFLHLAGQAQAQFQQRVGVFQGVLKAGQGLFAASSEVTADEWHEFASAFDLPGRYPAIKGFGVIFSVPGEYVGDFVARRRSDGQPAFEIRNLPGAEERRSGDRYVLTYFHPAGPPFDRLLGVDISGDPNRRAIVERARDTGAQALSGPVLLPIGGENKQGLVLYAPIYHRGMPTGSVAERRSAVRGWIFVPVLLETALNGVLRSVSNELELTAYLSTGEDGYQLLFGRASPDGSRIAGEHIEVVEIAGQRLTLCWNRSAAFKPAGTRVAWLSAIACAIFGIAASVALRRLWLFARRAHERLERQDAELAYQQFALDQHAIVSVTDAAGLITYANDSFCKVSGYSREELMGRRHSVVKSGLHSPAFYREMLATLREGKVWHGQLCNRSKEGALQWFAATIVPYPGPDGRPEKYVAIRSDITSLKQAQEQISETKARLTSIFEALDEGVLLQATDGRVLEANVAAERILSLSRAELTGSAPPPPGWGLMDEQGRVLDSSQLPHGIVSSTGRAVHGIVLGLKGAGGAVSWVSANAEPVHDDAGKIRAVVTSFIDITQRREAVRQLSESARRLQLAAEVAQIGVWDWDIPNNQLLADERACAIYGVPRPADGILIAAEWTSAVHPDDREEQRRLVYERIASGGSGRRRFRILRRDDGTVRYVESEEYVQVDASGKAVRMLGVQRDVTAQVEAQTALERSEERTRLFVEHAPASVAMFDLNMRYLVVSNQWMREFGLGQREMIGRSYYDVLPDPDGKWREIHHRCLAGQSGVSLVETIRGPEGQPRWLQWEVRPWHTAAGHVGGVVVFTLDVTARRELELSLERARDGAVTASRLKSEFLATMSHEIRTPMNGVIGMAGLLLRTQLDSRQREMTQSLVNSAERLLVIINDILDFSKIEAGKMRIEPVDFSLRDLLEEAATLMAASARKKGLDFACDIASDLGGGFRGDSGRIQQILTNLLGNAVKFTQKGEILLTARATEQTASEVQVCIEVKDTGVGIPESARKHLFEPFVQADGSSTRRFEGTGLGLAICSQLVSLMGGRINFESEEGRGSKFWVELPLARAVLPELDVSGEVPAEARVLVVDDHPVNRMVLLRQLEGMRVKAEAAAGAEEALAALLRESSGPHPFSIALIDLNMPGVGGRDLARTVRATPALRGIALVALSSAGGDLDPADAGALKLHAVLHKPVRESQLRRCLLRVYGRRFTPAPFPIEAPASGGLKVLLAEDNETNQLVAQLILEELGHTVVIAENGLEALAKLAAEPFDVVLMDCQMPQLDGYEATRRIRAGSVTGVNRSIPVIALTAYAMPSDRQRVIEAGMDDHVAKPISREALQSAFTRCGLADGSGTRAATALAQSAPVPASGAPQSVVAGPAPELTFDPVQRTKLGAMRSPSGETVWEKALAIFMKEMPARLASLSAQAEAQQGNELGSTAHTIAGSAASLGARALRTAALALENAAQANDWARVPSLLTALLDEWGRLLPYLTPPKP